MTNEKVAVVTDSACSLPAELAAARGVRMVPLRLHVGEATYDDGELTVEQIVDRLGDGMSTSGPPPGAFATAVEDALEEADAAVVLTVSSAMSSTFEAARVGTAAFGDRVVVLDTGTAAGAQGLVVLAAATRAAAGAGLEEVAAAADEVAAAVRLRATVDSLDQLVASGRVPGIAGLAGRALRVNPLFEFRRGEVRRLRPAFSRRAALDRIADAVRSSRPEGARLHLAVLHALAADEAHDLLARVSDGVAVSDQFVGAFSPVMILHTGPGIVGLAWWWEAGDGSPAAS